MRFQPGMDAGWPEGHRTLRRLASQAGFASATGHRALERLRARGIPIKSYDPLTDLPVQAADTVRVTDIVTAEMVPADESQT